MFQNLNMNYMNDNNNIEEFEDDFSLEDQLLEDMLKTSVAADRELRAVKSVEDKTKIFDPEKKFGEDRDKEAKVLSAIVQSGSESSAMKLAEVKTREEIVRTLDKMGSRREFIKALSHSNVTMERITDKLSELMFAPTTHPNTQLRAIGMVTKILGINDDSATANNSETLETIIKTALEQEKQKKLLGQATNDVFIGDYEVKRPGMPKSLEELKKKENDIASSLKN